MFKRLLVALDGSACARDAFDLALDLAAAQSSELAVCSVADDLGHLNAASELLSDARQLANSRGIACTVEVLEGASPAPAVIVHARQIGADCIVAGTHGRSGFANAVYGSVARELLEGADCAVLTIRRRRRPAHGKT